MPRFVVLQHETPPGFERGLHWDLMLEQDEVLRTWALAEEPCAGREIAAQELAVHRMAYLQYEGPIAGNRGTVTRWDEGEFQLLEETSEGMELIFFGRRLQGSARLAHDAADPVHWIFWLSTG